MAHWNQAHNERLIIGLMLALSTNPTPSI